jgi:hypothetical protein
LRIVEPVHVIFLQSITQPGSIARSIKYVDRAILYWNSRGAIIIGTRSVDSQISLFALSKEVLDYDLAAFFDRNSEVIKSEVYSTLEILLRAE